MRRGTSLAELLVGVAIGVVVLAGALVTMVGLRRMTQASDLAAALQDGALALAHIERDLLEAVAPADPVNRTNRRCDEPSISAVSASSGTDSTARTCPSAPVGGRICRSPETTISICCERVPPATNGQTRCRRRSLCSASAWTPNIRGIRCTSVRRTVDSCTGSKAQPWILSPAVLLVLVLSCFQVLLPKEKSL